MTDQTVNTEEGEVVDASPEGGKANEGKLEQVHANASASAKGATADNVSEPDKTGETAGETGETAEASEGTSAGEAPSTPAESFEFQTEIRQILQLIVHSLYTKREIFLRELVSNASDALNKVQFERLTNQGIIDPDAELEIRISHDDDARTLTISDTGLGMSHDELVENLGTIAHSGSKAFLERLKTSTEEGGGSALELIGQFGVGFYSVFMVGDKVTVETRAMQAGSQAYCWTSDGEGRFTIESSDRTARGTTITVHLKEDASEFLSKWRIEEIVKTYSNFVPFPIYVDDNQANRQKALWAQSKSELKEEDYNEFYGLLNHTTEKPTDYLHFQADVPIQFSAVLFIPHQAPVYYSPLEQKHGLKLYVKRVFIQDDCSELIPSYLRFIKGVVDVDDLPLNVGRELIQKNPKMAKVRSNLVRKSLKLMQKMADKEAEKYATFWKDFGIFLKEGVREDFENKDALAELLRFNSSHHEDENGITSLKEYVGRMVEGQEDIYYFTGTSRSALERSPHLEALKKKHYEVLYLTDAIDPLLVMALSTYDGKKLRIIDDPTLKISDEKKPVDEPVENLVSFMGRVLGDKVDKVRLSQRLVDSPSCLVNPEDAMSSDMQRLYGLMDKDFEMSKKILEVNPDHPMIKNLASARDKALGDPAAEEKLRPFITYIMDSALLAEGLHPNPAELVAGINDLLTIATGTLVPETGDSEPSPDAQS